MQIVFDALTEALYPMIFLKKVTTAEDSSTALASLTYPSLVAHDIAFGQNPYKQLGSTVQDYSFYGGTTAEFTYYTMAVYQENWGLTDMLKSEYQLLVKVDAVTKNEATPNGVLIVESASPNVSAKKPDEPGVVSGAQTPSNDTAPEPVIKEGEPAEEVDVVTDEDDSSASVNDEPWFFDFEQY